jgi:hypothetical protein
MWSATLSMNRRPSLTMTCLSGFLARVAKTTSFCSLSPRVGLRKQIGELLLDALSKCLDGRARNGGRGRFMCQVRSQQVYVRGHLLRKP